MSGLKSAWEISLEKSNKLVPGVEKQKKLTTRQKELLREFEQEKADNSPQSQNFFSKVRGFWDSMTG